MDVIVLLPYLRTRIIWCFGGQRGAEGREDGEEVGVEYGRAGVVGVEMVEQGGAGRPDCTPDPDLREDAISFPRRVSRRQQEGVERASQGEGTGEVPDAAEGGWPSGTR